MSLNINKIREDFPILQKKLAGRPIIYLDNACQSLRPNPVINRIMEYYKEFPACGERSMHKLGKKVDEGVASARKSLQGLFNTKKSEDIIFTKNATESLNIVANALDLKKGDVVITTDKEHNSNLIPWQMLAKKGIKHEVVEFNNIDALNDKLTKDVKIVSMVHTSNLDGTSIDAKEMIKSAHDNGSLFMLDACQSAPHKVVDVKKLDVDFMACSGHKMLGPSGVGLLYGKQDALAKLKPFIVGGSTVSESTYKTCEFEKAPHLFEPGLQNYAGIMGFGAAADYLKKVGLDNISAHELKLNKKITDALADSVELLGPLDPKDRGCIFSFNVSGIEMHNVAIMLDEAANIMLRSGAHCGHSWFNAHKMLGSIRASLYLYNTEEECDMFIQELQKLIKLLS
ncbi:aminotransferase class V-fold PLP-dependent enzyme [Candidatus Woesearchaeota archaeon]|nr:aminotransferase class V-fold PLP-dependent enzyme [Candidatus Woesearchaeota archaeon]MBW2993822.1 aminotransferase class V-fold PLP-dependent enzyme [Candidatus Woesearchaeota archaeon]